MPLMKSFAGSSLMLLCSLAVSCPSAAAPLITYRLDTPRTGLVIPVAPGQRAGPATTVNPRPSGSGELPGRTEQGNPPQTIEAGSVAVPGRSISSVPSVGARDEGRRRSGPAGTQDFRRCVRKCGTEQSELREHCRAACGHRHDRNAVIRRGAG